MLKKNFGKFKDALVKMNQQVKSPEQRDALMADKDIGKGALESRIGKIEFVLTESAHLHESKITQVEAMMLEFEARRKSTSQRVAELIADVEKSLAARIDDVEKRLASDEHRVATRVTNFQNEVVSGQEQLSLFSRLSKVESTILRQDDKRKAMSSRLKQLSAELEKGQGIAIGQRLTLVETKVQRLEDKR